MIIIIMIIIIMPSSELTYPRISPAKGTVEDDVLWSKVGYVSSLEGNMIMINAHWLLP